MSGMMFRRQLFRRMLATAPDAVAKPSAGGTAAAKIDIAAYKSSIETPDTLVRFIGKVNGFKPPTHTILHSSGNILCLTCLAGAATAFLGSM